MFNFNNNKNNTIKKIIFYNNSTDLIIQIILIRLEKTIFLSEKQGY